MTRVSVAIAVHDDDAYLADALESVLAEIGPDDEIVVVDDGSTDNTPAILDRYADRVRRLAPGRVGLSAARNLGVAASRGRYLGFLDADDLWTPGSLQARVEALEASKADVVLARTDEFLDEGVEDPAAHGLRPAASRVNAFFLGAVLGHRRAFADVPFDESQPMAITVDWLGRATHAGLTVEHVDVVALRRRLRPGSMTADGGQYHHALLDALRANIGARRGPS